MKLKLKVDNLKHVSDHGLAVQFDNPQLQAWVDGMRGNGVHECKAGESKLKLTVLGRLCITELHLAVGDRKIRNLHYYDPVTELSYTQCDCSTQAILIHLIFGGRTHWDSSFRGVAAYTSSRISGLQRWAKDDAWAILGESGMRAKAIEKACEPLAILVKKAKERADDAKSISVVFSKRNLELELANMKKEQSKLLAERQKAIEECQIKIGMAQDANASEASWTQLRTKDYNNICIRYVHDGDNYAYLRGWRGTSNPALVVPNYDVSMVDGAFKLSSGIACDVTLDQMLAWLRGQTEAPKSKYGIVTRVETRDGSMQPRLLFQVGCHIVDLCALHPELDELLQPTHTVVGEPDVSDLAWTEENMNAIRQRLVSIYTKEKEDLEDKKHALHVSYVPRRRKLTYQINNREMEQAKFDAKAEETKLEYERSVIEYDKTAANYGGITLPEAQTAGLTILNTMCLHPLT